MCLYVSLDSMDYKCCRANHVSLILKHHMIMCSYTLPYFAHFLYLMHTHTHTHTHTLTCLSDYCHAYIIWFWNIIWLCVHTLCPILHTFYIWCAHTHTHTLWHVWVIIVMLISFYRYYMFSHVNLVFELCFEFSLVFNSKFLFWD